MNKILFYNINIGKWSNLSLKFDIDLISIQILNHKTRVQIYKFRKNIYS